MLTDSPQHRLSWVLGVARRRVALPHGRGVGLVGALDVELPATTTLHAAASGKQLKRRVAHGGREGLDDATADLSLRVVAACLALGLLSFAPLAVGDAEGPGDGVSGGVNKPKQRPG